MGISKTQFADILDAPTLDTERVGAIQAELTARLSQTGLLGASLELLPIGSQRNGTAVAPASDLDFFVLPTDHFAPRFLDLDNERDEVLVRMREVVEGAFSGMETTRARAAEKCIKLTGDFGDVDLTPAIQAYGYDAHGNCVEGVEFITGSGERIFSAPRTHIANGEDIDRATNGAYTETVRAAKAARSEMVKKGVGDSSLAHSFHLESYLRTASNEFFEMPKTDRLRQMAVCILSAPSTDLVAINELYSIFGPGKLQWHVGDAQRYSRSLLEMIK